MGLGLFSLIKLRGCALACGLLLAGQTWAALDIRIANPGQIDSTSIGYVASIGECSRLETVQINAASSPQSVSISNLSRAPEGVDQCYYQFDLEGEARFNPSISVTRAGGVEENLTESFAFEEQAPSINFQNVAIQGSGSEQNLVIRFDALDNADIAYVAYQAIGLRASQLRSSGGVIEEARQNAFAETSEFQRSFPSQEGQSEFSVSIPITSPLSDEEIAFDAIILLDLMAVDASGNQTSISRVAFTGDSIEEEARALIVSTTGLVINNSLQTPVIVPAVDFQFRGVVSLSGPGNGITYTSSHPDLIGVTNGGVVFALQETGSTNVVISVSYEDLPSIDIPVTADFSKTLVGLGVAEVSVSSPLTLPSLNEFHPLPEIQGIFDDGSRTAIAGHWTPVVTIPEQVSAFIEQDRQGQLKASVAVPEEAPLNLELSVVELPGIQAALPVSAQDAAPLIEMELPPTISVQETLTIQASVSDDVGVAQVEYFLDGASIGSVTSAPYLISLPISEQLSSQTLNFIAIATDSIGQSTSSNESQVTVVAPSQIDIPDFKFSLPIDGQRVVESSPLRLQIESSLGVLPDADSQSGITRVDFFHDGALAGSASFPRFEVRETIVDGEVAEELIELWSVDMNVPSISTTETSLSIGAQVFTRRSSENAPSKLVRIIENRPPQIELLTPAEGEDAVAGGQINFTVQVTDETLSLGTQVELLIDGQVYDQLLYQGSASEESAEPDFENIIDTDVVRFTRPVTEEDIGSTLSVVARVTDFHQQTNQTTARRIPVRADQPPTVAISNPTDGTSFVSGLPIQIRANAVDDLKVEQVDFYVNSALVGSDSVAPYAFLFETQENINLEQALTIHAVVRDSADQEAQSNQVTVTLGQDEEPPVVNISSPFIDASDDVASILEQTEFALKVAGFDNVGAVRAQVTGIARQGNRYVLTGNPADVISDEEFPLEQIPGVLRAYSGLRLVRSPEFQNSSVGEFDRYPVSITVYDEIGNASTANIIIGVFEDQAPEVVSITPNKNLYFPQDTISSDVLLRDDRSIERVEIDYLLENQVVSSSIYSRENGLVPMATLQIRDDLELPSLNLDNRDQAITIQVVAYDILGQQSEQFERAYTVQADTTAPSVSILQPQPGATLFSGQSATAEVRVVDQSGLAFLQISFDDEIVFSQTVQGRSHTQAVEIQIPDNKAGTTLEVLTRDVLDNAETQSITYAISEDTPPTIAIRQPAAGSRLLEGEPFTINASVSDNRKVEFVEIFVERAGNSLFSKTFSADEIASVINNGGFFSAQLRVPNRPETDSLVIGVRARDDAGLLTIQPLDLVILDDLEEPIINFDEPAEDFSIYAGDAFAVQGAASDNIFVQSFTPYLIQDNEEIELEWEIFTRSDRIEQIRVDNPDSFGTVVAAERFFSDYSGRIRLPVELQDRAGESFDFVVRAADRGINESDSNSVTITIREDDEEPVIDILSPDTNLVDRQDASIKLSISDNVSLEAYQVSIIDSETRVISQANDLDVRQLDIGGNELRIDLDRYVPVPQEGAQFTVNVTATDRSGNSSSEARLVTVLPDQAPVVEVIARDPNTDLVRSQPLFSLVRVSDDLIDSHSRYAELYSSIQGLESSDRSLVYGLEAVSAVESKLLWQFSYPEWADLSGQLFINDKEFWNFEQAVSSLTAFDSATVKSLKLVLNGYTVDYQLTLSSNDLCEPEQRQIDVLAESLVDGVLPLTDYVNDAHTRVVVTPIVRGLAADQVALRSILISSAELPRALSYELDDINRRVPTAQLIQLIVADGLSQAGLASIHVSRLQVVSDQQQEFDRFSLSPVIPNAEEFKHFAAAVDRMSIDRGVLPATLLSTSILREDDLDPEVSITAPVTGSQIVPGQTIQLKVLATDNTQAIDTLRLFDNGTLIAERGGRIQFDEEIEFQYTSPLSRLAGDTNLSVVAQDQNGRASSSLITLSVNENRPPLIDLRRFASYRVNNQFVNRITEPERLNFAEFYVRIGESFELATQLSDDAGLERYEIRRINPDGSATTEYEREFSFSCPELPTTQVNEESTEILFNQIEPTEYEIILTDNTGQRALRRFVIFPLANVAPEIRVTRPAEGQFIVAGTFQLEVGLLAADDRQLSFDQIQLFANGVPLTLQSLGGEVEDNSVIQRALNSIYDALEDKYSVAVADEVANINNPNLMERTAVFSLPSSLIRANEDIVLTAQVRDSDGAIGTSEIRFIGAADQINPEIAIIEPTVSFAPPEFSDFSVRFRGFDNVKVSQLEFFTGYGAQLLDGSYVRSPNSVLLRTISDIQDVDFEPITSNNIDTLIYEQLVHVDRLAQIAASFEGLLIDDVQRYDIWVRVLARDASGNVREREISFPVRIDERPVIDIVSPINGGRVVESTDMLVNVNAFDDVGIDSLRMVAKAGAAGQETEISNLLLRQPPYSFSIRLPEFNAANLAANRIVIDVEAIDTYGAAFGDLDQHLARETIVVEIVEDVPPEIVIGTPQDGDSALEGEFVLVQVNAIDDVAVDRVTLNVANLVNGDRVFTDAVFPYEFLLEIPYGQAGQALDLTASVTELRLSGEPRTVQTSEVTQLIVGEDTLAPDLRIIAPAETGSAVAESRNFPFQIEAQDNVRVSSLSLELFVDTNLNGEFENNELREQQRLIAPPYFGSVNVDTIAAYLDQSEDLPEQLAMQLRVRAFDGAGNESLDARLLTLVKNSPPSINDIRVLDERGNNLGILTSITEGREFVLSVVASDPEVGVDRVQLFRAFGDGSGNASEFEAVGEDGAAPFNFNFQAPLGRVGESIAYRAIAIDIDGNASELSSARVLTLAKDEPPTAVIITPAEGAVVIDGQQIEVTVEALDDLGFNGIDRVEFYLNDDLVFTAFQSDATNEQISSGERFYSAEIEPPLGVDGFVLQAVAYDRLNQAGESQVVNVGRIDDTVAPNVSVLAPIDQEILTTAEPLVAVVAVTDIGVEEERRVFMDWVREAQDQAGIWQELDSRTIELFRDDGDSRPPIAESDPDNFYFVYWSEFADGNILQRGAEDRERVRIVTRVETPNHDVASETVHEIGMPISERRFYGPGNNNLNAAQQIYYSSVDQFISADRQGAMIGAWSTHDPVRADQLFVDAERSAVQNCIECTGLFLLDLADEQNDAGDILVAADLVDSASQIFAGTITNVHADANFVMASKSGVLLPEQITEPSAFVTNLENEIDRIPDTGDLFYTNQDGELLIYTTQNGDNQFGLPYQLAGRVDLPFKQVLGLDRKDDLVLVANGFGGVQLIDVSDFNAPYRIGFIKPNGFARDVVISGQFAFIAASTEGVVVADISDPNLPIIDVVDTLGVANRLHLEGNRLFVTDMSGEGRISRLTEIDIRDPRQPEIARNIDLNPARADLVSDGVYDVTIAGNKAYASIFYSDQEDKPAQAVVEIIDLARLDQPSVDATIPSMVIRDASDENFSVRDLTLARGAVQAAAGQAGINRIEFTELQVVAHQPLAGEAFVSTDLNKIEIELSAVLPPNVDLNDIFEIFRGAVLADGEGGYALGEPIGDQFTARFAERNGEPARRFIVLESSTPLESGQEYVVLIRQGLQPLTGNALSADYLFSFFTSPAGSLPAPDITAILPNSGTVQGGQEIQVQGTNFGQNAKLFLGGLELVVDRVESGTEFDTIFATTIPNQAGPAAITVVNDAGLEDIVVGAYNYLDILQLSFVSPAVVNISQAGQNDQVQVVGFGFGPDLSLIAYPSGQPERAVTTEVDGDRLTLNSGQSLSWIVPDFGGDYRGFVDIEVRDQQGRSDFAPQALFYGGLSVNAGIDVDEALSSAEISGQISAGEQILPRDPSVLPPGQIVDITSDSELGLIYVLGRGTGDTSPDEIESDQQLRSFIAPSWIELIGYQRDQLENAAPLFGLGYFDLPQDLNAAGMTLGDQHLYVTARGMDFPNIRTPHENQTWLLVYDREDRRLGEFADEAQDRDILYRLPIPLSEPPSQLVVSDGLLIANGGDEGLLFISLAAPEQPVVLRKIQNASINGVEKLLRVDDIAIRDDLLFVTHFQPSFGGEIITRLVYDLSKPGTPQIADQLLDGAREIHALSNQSSVAFYQSGVSLLDVRNVQNASIEGLYQANGFDLPGSPIEITGTTSLLGNLNLLSGRDFQGVYVNIFDTSRADQIRVLDSLFVTDEEPLLSLYDRYALDSYPFHQTDDGLIVLLETFVTEQNGSATARLSIIDTFAPDLVESTPSFGEQGVTLNTPITLSFSRPIAIPNGENENQYLSRYLSLIKDVGNAQGEQVATDFAIDVQDGSVVHITPQANLDSQTQYRIELRAEPSDGGRRATGLFDHQIIFSTGSGTGLKPIIKTVSPTFVTTDGGVIKVVVENSDSPTFEISGQAAAIESQQPLADNQTEYLLRAPAQLAGPASIFVREPDGREAQFLGAFQYVEQLRLLSASPDRGTVVGGTQVRLTGRGFQPGENATRIFVGNNEVPSRDITVLDGETLDFATPPGQLGKTDIRVLTSGQEEILEDAFDYQQPVTSNISGPEGRIYDVEIDPTGTFAVTASGEAGVVIYNIASSTLTADVNDVTNANELLQLVDRDGDGVEDRIVSKIELPNGYAALGVDLFFERNNDRVFVTAARLDAPNKEARLFIYAIDSQDISSSTLVQELELGSDYAKGLEVENNQVIVAMAERGLGFVDAHLHSKIYLSEIWPARNQKPVLDVAIIDRLGQGGSRNHYAVVSGLFDFRHNRLIDSEEVGAGGFSILVKDTKQGLREIASLDIPASKVLLEPVSQTTPQPRYAYLSAGALGAIIVDITDLSNPRVVRRIQVESYDIAISGNVLYIATGQQGISSYDITNPTEPIYLDSYEGFDGNSIETLFATPFSVIGAGLSSEGNTIIQETPDANLKLSSVSPSTRVIDRGTDGEVQVRLRFNKAIDLRDENLAHFSARQTNGEPVSTQVEIINNDAIITLDRPEAFEDGEAFLVEVEAGLLASRPVLLDGEEINIELYELQGRQSIEFIYRGDRPSEVIIDAVVPRRIQAATDNVVSISALGVPNDPSRVRAYIGSTELSVNEIVQNSSDERIAILEVSVPPISAAGQYDVRLEVLRSSVWQVAFLRGGLQVDAPIKLISLSPGWGPVQGGTTVTLIGEGFEPGNTVIDGLTMEIGSQPVNSIQVLSSKEIRIVTPRGVAGKNDVRIQDRYGNQSVLREQQGFGYGISQLADIRPSLVNPLDIAIDQETGVALTSTGYFHNFSIEDITRNGGLLHETFFAASFDVQNPQAPLLVGGVPTLPSSEAGFQEQQNFIRRSLLEATQNAATSGLGEPLTEAEQAELESLSGAGKNLAFSVDSQRLQILDEFEEGIERRRAYLAAGVGGVAQLNFDEQNGLQVLSRVGSGSIIRDIEKSGYALFTTAASGVDAERPRECFATVDEAGKGGVATYNYVEPNDPLVLGNGLGLSGGEFLSLSKGWLINGGQASGALWGPCPPAWEVETAAQPSNGRTDFVQLVNVFDPLLSQRFDFDNTAFEGICSLLVLMVVGLSCLISPTH